MSNDLSDFWPAQRNANRHTPRGLGLLDQSMSEDGYVTPMTATADGEVIDGSARLERAAERFAGVETIVIEHDGTRPIIAKRMDIPNADTPAARRIALRANRIGQVDLDWSPEELSALAAEMPDVTAALWTNDEWQAVLAAAQGTGANAGSTGTVHHASDAQLGALQYSVIVECAGEDDQAVVLSAMEAEGRSCRALIS